MDTRGRHLLVEYYGCDRAVLDDEPALRGLLREAARAAGATEVAVVFHRFSPQGVSGVVVVEESHLSVHTWPEVGYAAFDFYTCGDGQEGLAHDVLMRGLRPERAERMCIERGMPGPSSMRVASHAIESGEPPVRLAAGGRSR